MSDAEGGLVCTDRLVARTLSGLFDESFDVYKRNFKTLALIAAVLFFPTQIALHGCYETWIRPLQLRIVTPWEDPDPLSALLAILGACLIGAPEYGLPGVLSFVVFALVSGPLCVAVSDILLGRLPSIKEAFRRAGPAALRLLCGWICAGLMCLGIAFACGALTFVVAAFVGISMGAEAGAGAMMVIWLCGLAATYVLSVAVVARYAVFMAPLVVLEGLSITAVWDRNRQLVGRVRFSHTVAAAAALPLLVFGLQYLILFSVDAAIGAVHLTSIADFVVRIAFTAGIVLFFQPYFMVMITALYYDYRVRGEGFDVVLLSTRQTWLAPSPTRFCDPRAGEASHTKEVALI